MKNFKQIAFGLILGAMVIGFSAFTNAKTKTVHINKAFSAKTITDDYLVQSGGAGVFAQSADFDSSNCGTAATLPCGYDVTTSGKSNIPNRASYSSSDISNYVSHNWLAADSQSSNAQYGN